MTLSKKFAVVAILGAMSAAAMTTQASATQITAQRAHAIMVCNQRAEAAYPAIVPEGHHGRSEVYAACMTEAGQLP